MGTLHAISAPPPALSVAGDRAPVANAYFGITIDAAVDLREARGYRSLTRAERVTRAQAEQREFLSGFLDPGLEAALDLRITVDPAAAGPVSVALLGRVWGGGADGAAKRAEELRGRVQAAIPRHVTATPVDDADAVARLLTPFPGATVDSAVITRHELIGVPSRPDAGVSYYYSAAPFNWSDDDWSAVYGALAASPVPLVLSVAVLPVLVPPKFAQTLRTLASFYGRLAKESEAPATFYHGRQRLAADAFTVDAEKVFHDYSRRLGHKAFALRIQVSAPRQLPPGIVETIAAAVSPAERVLSDPEQRRAVSAVDVRRPASVAERRLAEYNLNVINFGMLTGRREIWGRTDPPDPQLAMLTVLGDARDACCAFRLPVAADGVLPGFRVRRGQSGQGGDGQAAGPAIRVGKASATDRDVTLPLRWLTRHTLIAGSPGSGKTSTAIEILRQLWADHQLPFLVIEPANAAADDYRRLTAAAGFDSLEVITAGDESGAPLRFNPFEVPAGTAVGDHAANLLTCFTAAFGLSGPLPSMYRDALSLTYLRAGFLAGERSAGPQRGWPTVVDFRAAMEEVAAGLGSPGDARARIDAATVGRARQLVSGVTGSVFLTSRPVDIGRLLDHPVIVELKSLGDGGEQALMMALLLNAITEHGESARGVSSKLVHVTLIEEAGRLLARAPAGRSGRGPQASARAAATLISKLTGSRRHGEGVIISERAPAELVGDAVRQTGLKIMHRLTAEDDRRCLSEATGMDEGQRTLAARLRDGEALLYSDELAETVQASITPALRAGPQPPVTVKPSATPPFAACAQCRAQCTYRGAALSLLQDPRTVGGISSAAGWPESTSVPAGEEQAGLAGLRGQLYETVGRFAALPATEPGRSDAAFCLFLHVYASSPVPLPTGWPAVAAGLLGIAAAGGEGPVKSVQSQAASAQETDRQ
jgi:Helicase HerA, central domain